MGKRKNKGGEVNFPPQIDGLEYNDSGFVQFTLPSMTRMDKFWALGKFLTSFPAPFLRDKTKLDVTKKNTDALLDEIGKGLNKLDTKDLLACKYLLESLKNGKGIYKASSSVRLALIDDQKLTAVLRGIDSICSVRNDLDELTTMTQESAIEVLAAA